MRVRCRWNSVMVSFVFLMGMNSMAHALTFERPVEGQRVVAGEPFDVWVRLDPKDKCDWVGPGLTFNSETGRYEGTFVIRPDEVESSQERYLFSVDSAGRRCGAGSPMANLTVVLPPSTTVVSIDAHVLGNKGDKNVFLLLKLTPQKALLRRASDRISVEGRYSDGVDRDISIDPKTTYESLNEKIATVSVKDSKMVVTPMEAGETEIVVRHGSYQDRLEVSVKEVICQDEEGFLCR